MTDGDDGVDDQSTAERPNESRGGDSDHSSPRRSDRTTTGANSGVRHAEAGMATERGESDDASPTDSTVSMSGEVGDTGDWVDLGEYLPAGETLVTGDIPAEKIREYTTQRRSLSPLVQIRWAVRVIITALVAGTVSVWGFRVLDVALLWSGAVTGILLLVGFVWIVLHYRLWVYQIRADAIYLERGVVTNVQSLVPYVRVQHVDTSRSPVERLLGLSTLVVYTAGSRGADVSIPGLNPEEARDLQRRVKELAIEAEGDDAV